MGVTQVNLFGKWRTCYFENNGREYIKFNGQKKYIDELTMTEKLGLPQ